MFYSTKISSFIKNRYMKSKSLNTSNFLPLIIIFCFLCIGFVPNWGAVDKIAPQWLTLSILNTASLIIIILNPSYFSSKILRVSKNGIALFYFGFLVWGALSYYYAINSVEVIVNITRHVNTFFMYLHLLLFISGIKNKINIISWAIVIILGVEIYAVLIEAYNMSLTPDGIKPGVLKGVTANRNIGAFSLAVKIPFVLYLILFSRKFSIKISLGILVFLTILGLSLISSRASYIAVLLVSVMYLSFNFYEFYKDQNPKKLIPSLYIIIPVITALLSNQLILSGSNTANAFERASTITVDTSDGSINQRLRYYQDVLTQITNSPFIGTGLGNWKLASIDYDKDDIEGYIVPYHAHSDFIQLGAELGIIGFLLYLGVFAFGAYSVYNILRSNFHTRKEKVFVYFLLAALGVYTIDANLNFPIARPQVLAPWAMIMAFISFYYNQIKEYEIKTNKKFLSMIYVIVGLFIFIPTLNITNTVYNSHKSQMTILRDFNSNQYNIPLNQIESFVPTVPNITVTTIPMDAIKARYYNYYQKYDKALEHLENASNQNPYLMYPELLASQIYSKKGNKSKAKELARKAFFNLPNNAMHASNYMSILIQDKDKEGLNEAFGKLTYKNRLDNWKNYLIAVTNIFQPGDEIQTDRAKKATKLFSGNKEIYQLYKLISLGAQRINDGLNYSNSALTYFNQGNHLKAVEEFEKAISADPLEYSYRENIATSYYLLDDLNNSLKHIDVVINDLNPLDGKCEYIKALIFLKFGDPAGACPLLRTSRDSGYSQAEITYDQYCVNI